MAFADSLSLSMRKDLICSKNVREYFVSFEDAFNCASESKWDFTISKIKLHRGKTQWDEDYFYDGVVAYIIYSECESILCWGYNFEFLEISIPHPFEKGDMIRIAGTGDYGIMVEYGEGDECEGEGKVNKHESITIELVDENMLFSHFHVPQSKLEYKNLPEGDLLSELLRIAGYMSQ